MKEYLIFLIFLNCINIVSTINNAEKIYSLETCNIPEEFSLITQREFSHRYGGKQTLTTPVVFRQLPINKQFLNMMQLDSILKRYGNKYITVTTANTYSYQKQYIKLNDYINLQRQSSAKITKWGNETLYWFGDDLLNDQNWLNQILRYYKSPAYIVDDFIQPSLTFGMGGQGTGVPFHFHGPGFQQMIFGRKRWYLSAEKPSFDPNETTIQWATEKRFKTKQPFLYECTLNPGDMIFFPNLWWHATLNLDFAIFLSTFLSL
ncbi:unnamed protein product [Adineta steineri]|uniref:JmjC domain-containing protein n=1 Tax=Adineta steineri TaxID=433720 RepID=A0A814WDG9_9BILA|nr:unnamed protein product [Adineta steineri]CAF1199917.1 unnamed protein product [Adineta steineri]